MRLSFLLRLRRLYDLDTRLDSAGHHRIGIIAQIPIWRDITREKRKRIALPTTREIDVGTQVAGTISSMFVR
jgi:hypothetical protein